MSSTLDANILLYASDASSPFHDRARAIVEQSAAGPGIVYLFWPVVVAYLRLATHPAVFAEPLSLAVAVGNVEALLSRPHVRAVGEGDGFWGRLRTVIDDAAPVGSLMADAHLVALMAAHEVTTIWTHDRDFRRFRDIEMKDPFPASGPA